MRTTVIPIVLALMFARIIARGTETRVAGIKQAVYVELLSGFFTRNTNFYGACFFDTAISNEELLKRFTNQLPRIEIGTNNLVIGRFGAKDKVTGKPAVLFQSQINFSSATRASVSAGWYSCPESGAWTLYELRRDGTNWVVHSKKLQKIW